MTDHLTFLELVAVAIIGVMATAVFCMRARGQEHPPQDVPLHEQFYSTWYMPDKPARSCCNMNDCYPTVARFRDGQWWAERREDNEFIPIPWAKVETRRDSPDGRSHLCAPPPDSLNYEPGTVFCFALGSGI